MESFGHKMFILSQPVPLTGRGVLYPRVRDFYIALRYQEVTFICNYVCGYVVPSFLTNFGALYLTEFLTNFGQILNSKSCDQT